MLDYIYIFWLLLLSGLAIWIVIFFRRLSRKLDKGNLVKLIDTLIKDESRNTKGILEVNKKIARLEKDAGLHIQKIGLVKFNPFKELGGDHSFSLALLDDHDTGIIVTGLHTRERTRVYIKDIKKGKCKHKLSSEESKSLQQARKKK